MKAEYIIKVTDYSKIGWKMNKQLHKWIWYIHNCKTEKTNMISCRSVLWSNECFIIEKLKVKQIILKSRRDMFESFVNSLLNNVSETFWFCELFECFQYFWQSCISWITQYFEHLRNFSSYNISLENMKKTFLF